jgi:type IV secretion system protein TrbL
MCRWNDVGCGVREGFQSVATSMFADLATKIRETAESGVGGLATFWMKVDTPQVATQSGEQWTATGPVAFLHSYSVAIAASVFMFAIMLAGIRTAWEQRGEPIRELLKATMMLVLVAGMGTATIQLLSSWADGLALEIVQNATHGKPFSTALGGLVIKGGGQHETAQLPMIVMSFCMLAVFVTSVIQIILLLIRSAMLVLLAGTFPIAAAATNTEAGKAWFKKYCAWALAFIAYKPAAALIYAAAMKMNEAGMTNKSGNGLVQALTGLMMMLLAIFALPALLRFAVPVTAAVAGGGSGAGAAVADPGNVATGALNLGRPSHRAGTSSGGAGGGDGGGKASGAIAVGAGAALSTTRKAAAAISTATSHSAGEPADGSPTPSPTRTSATRGGGGGGSGSRTLTTAGGASSSRTPSGAAEASSSRTPSGGRSSPSPVSHRSPEHPGPTGSG